MRDAVLLEQLGVPTLTIAHSTFEAAARAQATCLGLSDLALYIEPAPAGGNRPSLTPAILSGCVSRLLEALTAPSATATGC